MVKHGILPLLVGSLCTFSVAWGSAYFWPTSSRVEDLMQGRPYDGRWHDVVQMRGHTFRRIAIVPTGGSWIGVWLDEHYRLRYRESAQKVLANLGDEWPQWARFGEASDRAVATSDWAGVMCDARGWPGLALRCSWRYTTTGVTVNGPVDQPPLAAIRGGIELPEVPSPFSTPIARALPYVPIWPGFLLNTGLYAAAWMMLFGGLFGTRRLFRLRRNRCPSCGYSLAGQTIPGCPECGWSRIERIGDAAQ